MSRRWIRLDVGWDLSEWMVELDACARLAWVKLLCWTKVHGKGGRTKALAPTVAARQWGVPTEAVEGMLGAAMSGEDPAVRIEDGDWVVVKWPEYQEPDRTATKRKRKQRAKESRVSRRDMRDGRCDPSRDHRPPTETEYTPSGEGVTPRARDPVFGHLDDLAVRSIKGQYGWPPDVTEGTDEAVWASGNGVDRKRCVAIAVARLEGEGREYQGRLFRRILETVIAEQVSAHKNDLSHWED